MRSSNLLLSLLFLAISCKNGVQENLSSTPLKSIFSTNARFQKIKIIPLGTVNQLYINTVSTALKDFYGCQTIIEKPHPLEKRLLSASRNRYSADSILAYLDEGTPRIYVTEKDIVYWGKFKKQEWGILGLAKTNGNIAVVSSYKKRMGRSSTHDNLLTRLRKVSIHEVGHNLGLDHCTFEKTCVMLAAEGTVLQIDHENESFCSQCKNLYSSNSIF